MSSSIVWPLVSNVIRGRSVNNTFGMVRKHANGGLKPHQGWDLEASVGDPVYSISDGQVVFVRDGGDYGVQLCVSFPFNGATYYAFYAHLQRVYVEEKASVERNTLIAASGKTGNASSLPSSEDHLHFEIRTKESPRLGLQDRVSPIVIYGKCPLTVPIAG